jgi:hypothetical protein
MNLLDISDDIITATVKPAKASTGVTLFKENCKKCSGTGNWTSYSGYTTRTCYACKGVGFHEFKTDSATRAKARERSVAVKASKEADRITGFAEQHEAEYNWMVESAPTFSFAQNMLDALKKYGSLTERQLASVQKCVISNAERAIARAQEQVNRVESAPEVNLGALADAFNSALSKGNKYPRLRLDSFVFTPAPAEGKNAGAIYIKEDGQYLGKVLGNKFLKVRECSEEQEKRIIEASVDPKEAAIKYGRMLGACSVCGKTLKDPESIQLGIGPICAGKMGW